MEGQLRGTGQAPGELTAEAIAALRALDATEQDPLLLGYHPVARMNPYQRLLYQRAWSAGIAPIPIIREERFGELTELARRGTPTVLHLHWLNRVLGDASSVRDAQKRRQAFLAEIDRYLAAGGRLAWTVHNILPHGTPFEREEAGLSADIVDRCSVVHIMASGTPALVADWFAIPPHKVLDVPHPSYAGAYEDSIDRLQARHELGIQPDELVHVVVGAIKPYKGLTELLDAWDRIALDGAPRRLLIAGAPSNEPGIAQVIERAALHPTVLVHARRIPAGDMQIFLRAADVAVLPYLRSLNSGALMLALTFGLPVVVPAGGGLAEVVDERMARTFDPDDVASLASALVASGELATAAARTAAARIAADRAPGPLSERFAHGLRAAIEGGRRPEDEGPPVERAAPSEAASGAPAG